MRLRASLPAAAILAVALLGCATGGGEVPATRYYTLGPPIDTDASGIETTDRESAELVVGVDAIVVDPPYDQDRLVFRIGAESPEVGFYHYHRWAAPLGRLVEAALAEGLRGTPGISAIEPSSSNANYSARLTGRLVYLEEVDRPEGQEVRLALELELRDRAGAILWAERLIETAEVDVETVPDIVTEVQRLFDRLVVRTRSGIATALGVT